MIPGIPARKWGATGASLLLLAGLGANGTGAVTNRPPRSYSLQHCLEIGLERAVSVANARRDEQIAAARITTTRASVLPQLALSGSYTRLDEVSSIDMGDGTSFSFGNLDNYSAAASLSQLLFNGGQVNAALRAAQRYRQYTAYGVAHERARLICAITLGFHDVLLAQAAADVQRQSVRHLEEFLSQTRARFAQQTVSEFDVLSAQVRLANERPKWIEAQNQLLLARDALRNRARLDEGDYLLTDDAALPPMTNDLAALQLRALTQRPDIRQVAALLSMQEEDVAAAKGQYYPALQAFANYTGGNSSSYDVSQSDWSWHWNAGLSLSWSLFDGGARQGRVAEKKITLAKTRATLDDLKRAAALEVSQAYLELARARETLASTRETVALAERALAIARTRYEQGLSTALEFTETNVALSAARLGASKARRDYLCALAQLAYASGQDSLEPHPESQP
jgi:outer membrane protein TolC